MRVLASAGLLTVLTTHMHGPGRDSLARVHTGKSAFRDDMKFGEALLTDARIARMRDRERFLFDRVEPMHHTWRTKWENIKIYFVRGPLRSAGFYILLVSYLTVSVSCSYETDSSDTSSSLRVRICSGPSNQWSDWSEYFPAMLNTLTAFLLVFYLNHCFLRYQICIDICQDLKKAVNDMMILSVGTIGDKPQSTAILMEFWRTLNLVHITAYEGKDTEGLFSFQDFVLPVASAFGVEEFGMFTREEVDEIRMHANMHRTHILYHQLLFSRLYRLTQTAIANQYTTAAWPVWQNALAGLRCSTERLMHHATFRVPEIYVIGVSMTAFITLMIDFFMLATGVGAAFRDDWAASRDLERLLDGAGCSQAASAASSPSVHGVGTPPSPPAASAAAEPCVAPSAYFGWWVAIITSVLVFSTATIVEVIRKAAFEFETPFGDDPMDLPVLSWVNEVARGSLEMVIHQSRSTLAREDTEQRVARAKDAGEKRLNQLRAWQSAEHGSGLLQAQHLFRLAGAAQPAEAEGSLVKKAGHSLGIALDLRLWGSRARSNSSHSSRSRVEPAAGEASYIAEEDAGSTVEDLSKAMDEAS